MEQIPIIIINIEIDKKYINKKIKNHIKNKKLYIIHKVQTTQNNLYLNTLHLIIRNFSKLIIYKIINVLKKPA